MKTSLLLPLSLLFFASSVYSQTALKILPDPLNSAICPLTSKYHSVVAQSGLRPACLFTWSVSGGTIEGPATGASVYVKWNDTPGQGTLTVRTSNCSDPIENGNEVTATYTRLSVFGQNFPSGACNNSVDHSVCSNSSLVICADKMYIQGTGGVAQPPLKEVDAYLFTIPAGWREANTTNVGPVTISSTVNSITIEPVSSAGGTVTVVGTVRNTCGQNVSNSNPKTITITRMPAVSITSSAGSGYVARCGLTAPVSFTVTSVSCATSYTWSIPSGWSGSSSSNTIELTPNGLNGGTVTASVALSTGYSAVRSFNVPYSNTAPPAVHITAYNNGYQEFCPGESFTYVANPPAGYGYPTNFGFDWYADSGLLINGSSSSSSSPVHTATNTVTITAQPQSYGPKYVHARLNNLNCVPGAYGWSETRVGVYNSNEFTINGPSSVCLNSTADYASSYIAPDVTDYVWSAPSGWSYWGQGTPYFSVSVPWYWNGDEAITLRLGNRCGYTNTPFVLWLNSGYCGFSMSPNPASSTVTITDIAVTDGETAEATLFDKNNDALRKALYKNGKIEFDVSELPNGKYIVLVNYKGKAESKSLLIKH